MTDAALTRQLKRLTTMMILFQVVSVLSVVGMCVSLNYMLKVRLAEFAQQEARRSLLVGDFRQAINSLDYIRAKNFESIRLVDSSGLTSFSIQSNPVGISSWVRGFFIAKKCFLITPTQNDGAPLGTLEFGFVVIDGLGYALLLALALVLGGIHLANVLRRRLQRRYETEMRARTDAAIAKTTQMLAHDVRKPFSKMRSGLSLIIKAQDADRVRAISKRLVLEVDAAMVAVNGMLADIMEIGSNAEPAAELIDPLLIIRRTLDDVFCSHLNADFVIESDLRHDRMVFVDQLKMQRVFHNIVENAVQILGGRGRLWIKSATIIDDVEMPVVSMTIGNAGSIVCEDDLELIFGEFFTKGRKGGTGLGLAIAKKVVEQHGGTIFCRSSPDLGVEFVIELPASEEKIELHDLTRLPSHSSEYQLMNDGLKIESSVALADTWCAKSISETLLKSRPLVAVVEDDVFVSEEWKSVLSENVDCDIFFNPASFRLRFEGDKAFRDRLAVVVLDNYFDGSDETGVELAHELQKIPDLSVVFSSDAEIPESDRDVFDVVCGKKAMSWRELLAACGRLNPDGAVRTLPHGRETMRWSKDDMGNINM